MPSSSKIGVWKGTLLCFAVLVCSVANAVYMKRMTNAVPNHPVFLSLTHVVTLSLLFTGIVAYKRRYTREITPAMEALPWTTFATLGGFDSLAGILTLVGSTRVSGTHQQLIMQGTVPVSMGMSWALLSHSYSYQQMGGAAVILMGVVSVLWETSGDIKHPNGMVESRAVESSRKLYSMVYAWSLLPIVLSNIFKEKSLRFQAVNEYVHAVLSISYPIFNLL